MPNVQSNTISRRRYSKIEESFLKNNNGFQIIEVRTRNLPKCNYGKMHEVKIAFLQNISVIQG